MNAIRFLLQLVFASLPCCLVAAPPAGNIDGPAQRAIVLYDQGREDLVLQAGYQGPAEEFGWLIPLPGKPAVRQGSLDCFYDLSRLTQKILWPQEFDVSSMVSSVQINPVKTVDIETVGSFEVAVLSPQDTNSLFSWLADQHLVFPENKRFLLESYVKNHWSFLAAKIKPDEKRSASRPDPPAAHDARVAGELRPLIISFPSEKCVCPLSLSAAGRPGEVSVFVLSREPLMSRVIFERKLEAYQRSRTEWIGQRPARERAWYARTNQALDLRFGLTIPPSASTQGAPRGLYDDPADPRPPPEIIFP